MSAPLDRPDDPLWDFSVEFYGRPGVEEACLDLERRHALDVNLVMGCCFAGVRGLELDRSTLVHADMAVRSWQVEVVRPLRAVRRRLKVKLADPEPLSVHEDWSELAAGIRARVLELELDAEHLEQLTLSRMIARAPAEGVPGADLAARNLRHYWSFDERDRYALRSLIGALFPDAPQEELEGSLSWIDR